MPYFFAEITVRDCMLTCSKKKKTQGKSLKTTFLVVKQILFEKKMVLYNGVHILLKHHI